jgi:S-methylmethionine-dependent homocysteine/selenocysteine methylase
MSLQHEICILDGGMGRELLRIGAPFHQPEWSALALLEGPEFVRRVHDAFIAAGANVITTNSYAVVPFHIGQERFFARGQELAALAGQLGRSAIEAHAATQQVRLAGSLPPVFGSYRPDLFNPDEARRILDPLVAGLSPFVDLWLAETLGSIAEAHAARSAIGNQDDRPFWLSFSLEDDDPESVARGDIAAKLRSGERIDEVAQAAIQLGAQALLFNCSHALVMQAAIQEARLAFSQLQPAARPQIGVYANAFAPHRHGPKSEANGALSQLRDDLTPQDYLAFARQWQSSGATIIGGCCGIGPEYIAALSSALLAQGKTTTNGDLNV